MTTQYGPKILVNHKFLHVIFIYIKDIYNFWFLIAFWPQNEVGIIYGRVLQDRRLTSFQFQHCFQKLSFRKRSFLNLLLVESKNVSHTSFSCHGYRTTRTQNYRSKRKNVHRKDKRSKTSAAGLEPRRLRSLPHTLRTAITGPRTQL